ncbi:MAG: heparinase, partial [Rhodobacterales bacterium CG18_big_fil_WC_8_21_14_2_50_71_9]
VGRQRLFGGVGPGAAFGPEWAVAARATAAHAALEIAGASAARLAPEGLAARVFGRGFAQGPSHVAAERLRDAGAEWLRAEHDGYA